MRKIVGRDGERRGDGGGTEGEEKPQEEDDNSPSWVPGLVRGNSSKPQDN